MKGEMYISEQFDILGKIKFKLTTHTFHCHQWNKLFILTNAHSLLLVRHASQSIIYKKMGPYKLFIYRRNTSIYWLNLAGLYILPLALFQCNDTRGRLSSALQMFGTTSPTLIQNNNWSPGQKAAVKNIWRTDYTKQSTHKKNIPYTTISICIRLCFSNNILEALKCIFK